MLELAQTTADPGAWWHQALASPLAIRLYIVAGVTLVLMLLCARAILRMRARRQSGECGTATIEFALVFPILLTFSLLLIQTALLFGGNLVVHYAAFAATRTAIVQVPYEDGLRGEPTNVLWNGPSGGSSLQSWNKYDRIRWAGVVGVWPVSGAGDASSPQANEIESAMSAYFRAYRGSEPRWVGSLIRDRLHYAADEENTQITLHRMRWNDGEHRVRFEALDEDEFAEFGPRDPITVQLTHRFNLSIPYVRVFFADDSQDGPGGYNNMYTEISTQYTLTNEGLVDQLPPLPTLERRP